MHLLEPNKPNGVFIREYGFLCNVCIKGRVESCQAAEPNQYFWHSIDVLKAKWYLFHEIDSDEDNDDDELEETDMFFREWCYKVYCKGQLGIIFTGYDHNYYLAKLRTNIYETGESGVDDNNHEMPVYTSKSYHLLLPGDHKNIKESTIYYIENKKKAMISTYCVAGVCATPEIH